MLETIVFRRKKRYQIFDWRGSLNFEAAAQLKLGRNIEHEEIEICRRRKSFESVHDEEELNLVTVTIFKKLKATIAATSEALFESPSAVIRTVQQDMNGMKYLPQNFKDDGWVPLR